MSNGSNNFRNVPAALSAIAQRQPGLKKPTLKRFTWSRFHSDLLDDKRWLEVADQEADQARKADLALVERWMATPEMAGEAVEALGEVGAAVIAPEAAELEAGLIAATTPGFQAFAALAEDQGGEKE